MQLIINNFLKTTEKSDAEIEMCNVKVVMSNSTIERSEGN